MTMCEVYMLTTKGRGGNASNSSTVLTNLGLNCELLTTFSNDKMFVFIIEDLKDRDIEIKNCRYYENCNIPLSTVLLSKDTGYRTIIHTNKNLPHVKFEDFDKCDLSEYYWVHFEARSVPETTRMMKKIKDFNEGKAESDKIKISLELEKKRDENMLLIKYADVAILGRDFAEILGCNDKKTAIYKLRDMTMNDDRYKNKNCMLICPWGKDGACALDLEGNFFESPIYPCETTIDTLGAGDTFTAGILYSLIKDFNNIQQAIHNGCKLAGFKCGFYGYDCVKDFQFS
ncbi:hypothetical protein ACKWTF_013303 [Chironomus riparius]